MALIMPKTASSSGTRRRCANKYCWARIVSSGTWSAQCPVQCPVQPRPSQIAVLESATDAARAPDPWILPASRCRTTSPFALGPRSW
jgi:hypothetical protein